jgi:hypothetical protein
MDGPAAGSFQEWFGLDLFQAHPAYWLHVYYFANQTGAKALFRKTLVEFFVDRGTDARDRLFSLGLTGELLDNEEVGTANEKFTSSEELKKAFYYILLKRSCAFLRDATPLAVTWAVEALQVCRAKDLGVSSKKSSAILIEFWRSQTSVQEWSGAT